MKLLICEHCQKTFSTVSNLNKHLRTKCNENKEIFYCGFCDYKTDIIYSLKTHLKTCRNKKLKENNKNEELRLIIKEETKSEIDMLKSENFILKQKIAFLTMEVSNLENDKIILEEQIKEKDIKIRSLEDNISNYLKYSSKVSESVEKINTNLVDYRLVSMKQIKDKKYEQKDLITNEETVSKIYNYKKNSLLYNYIEPINWQEIYKDLDELHPRDYKNGTACIYNKLIKHIKNKLVYTDEARKTVRYKELGEIKTDKLCINFISKVLSYIKNTKSHEILDNTELNNITDLRKDNIVKGYDKINEEYSRLVGFFKATVKKPKYNVYNDLFNMLQSQIINIEYFKENVLESLGVTKDKDYQEKILKNVPKVPRKNIKKTKEQEDNNNVLVKDNLINISNDLSQNIELKLLLPPSHKSNNTMQQIKHQRIEVNSIFKNSELESNLLQTATGTWSVEEHDPSMYTNRIRKTQPD